MTRFGKIITVIAVARPGTCGPMTMAQRDRWMHRCMLGFLVLSTSPAWAFDQSAFEVRPVAVTRSTGSLGPQLGPGRNFSLFNVDPSISAAGDVVFPGDLSPAGMGEGFWLHQGGQNSAIGLTGQDGSL